VRFIQDLITGDYQKYGRDKWLLFDVVSNKRNSIDVDKFDYLLRDTYYCGIQKQGADCLRLMSGAKAIGDSICYPSKDAYTVYEFFSARYLMYKKVYNNNKNQVYDLMIRDAMIEADPILNISQRVESCESYLTLTDYILQEIMFCKEPGIEKAQKILDDVARR